MRPSDTEFEGAMNALRDRTLRKDPAPAPPIVYHYTSAGGFQGIVESGMVWATDARFTNDTNELRHADDVLREVATTALSRSAGITHGLLAEFLENDERIIQPWFDVFVACFSEHHDLLTQWVAYADKARGYAIGIDTTQEGKAEAPYCCGQFQDYAVDLFQIQYDAEELRRRFAEFLEGFAELVGKHERRLDADTIRAISIRHLRVNAAIEGIRYKHHSSNHEREWRIAVLARRGFSPSKFRSTGGVVVPMVPLKLAANVTDLPIQCVYVGPAHRAGGTLEVAELGARVLLRGKCKSANLATIVQASQLTFRAL